MDDPASAVRRISGFAMPAGRPAAVVRGVVSTSFALPEFPLVTKASMHDAERRLIARAKKTDATTYSANRHADPARKPQNRSGQPSRETSGLTLRAAGQRLDHPQSSDGRDNRPAPTGMKRSLIGKAASRLRTVDHVPEAMKAARM
ncbi:hypothetical protein [Virgisporangium aurantiacum]|uniref:Uncharacterized protein n=1 Tax=Virgisporangium aurantiacum TaxID=175570 RepID=A0A8J3ZJJ7_9ACTN|nr:hypothetical protein [Virgisporangium aurantiacum]GIJ65039.1 hypothetical protein Vau01_125550 [Virgisporangium aurantiacum]